MTLQFKIRGQTLYKLTPGDVVEGTQNYINCQFDFQTEDWEGCIKTALFQPPGGVEPYPVMLVDGTCTVPWEALEHPGLVSVSVFGVKDDYKITSSVVQIRNRATLTGGAATEPPTPTVYEQVLNDLAGTRQHATEQAQESKAAADEAKGYADSAASVVDGFDAAAEAASKVITAEGALQVSNIKSAGQTAIQSVTAEGESQVAAVGAAGTEALQAVQDAAAEIVADREQISTNKDNIASLQSEMRTKADAIVRTVSGESLLIQDSSDDGLRGLRVFGKTTQNGTPTPDAPVPLVSVGDGGNVEVGVYGGNLLDYEQWKKANIMRGTCVWENNGVTLTATNENCYTMHSKENNTTIYRIPCNPGETFILTWEHTGNENDRVYVFYNGNSDNNKNILSKYGQLEFTIPEDCTFFTFRVGCYIAGTTSHYKNVRLSIKDARDFEPYTHQSLTIPTLNGLPGIPVTDASLANYTDESGQMWCSDEIDFERGVYVQRVKYINNIIPKNISTETTEHYCFLSINDLYENGERVMILSNRYKYEKFIKNDGICFAYKKVIRFYIDEAITTREEIKEYFTNNPTDCIYPLAAAIETPLTSDTLSMYSMLHTNYPVTTALNDAGAGMEMQYNADTQLYIDNKIAEVLASIANTNAQLL